MIAFTLPGGIPVYLFSLLMAFGTFLGLAWVVMRAESRQALELVEAGLWSLAGALIGGRIIHVIIAWSYYREQPVEAFQIYLGGLAWSGAMVGGLIGGMVYAGLNRRPVGKLLDDLAPLPTALAITAWVGCFIDGCSSGAAANRGGGLAADAWVDAAPMPIYAALATLVAFWIIDRLPERTAARSGIRAGLLLLSLSGIQLGAALITAPSRTWRGLPIDVWTALAVAGLVLLAIGAVYRTGENKRK